ncbi:hypothetical protein V6N11_059703 [Hibiscus sabdariffa]|uniref:RING-type E3 ubiquitin transferase n=1 Tax=Hibiscus sabdariffa TaxID=183260 RepID=A0ABR2NXT2_9ROSI
MQGQEKKLPAVGFKKLKKILKNYRREGTRSKKDVHGVLDIQTCPQHCSGKLQGSHVSLIQEGQDLVNHALINAIAIRKILKKYDKVHFSKQGQAFRSQAQSMHIKILQSPWLCELMAFHINLRETKAKSGMTPALFEGCFLTFNDGKPSLSCQLFDWVKLDIDLTCSICLDTVFDPVSLTCGHIFCYMCACSAASVTIVNGLKAAIRKKNVHYVERLEFMKALYIWMSLAYSAVNTGSSDFGQKERRDFDRRRNTGNPSAGLSSEPEIIPRSSC